MPRSTFSLIYRYNIAQQLAVTSILQACGGGDRELIGFIGYGRSWVTWSKSLSLGNEQHFVSATSDFWLERVVKGILMASNAGTKTMKQVRLFVVVASCSLLIAAWINSDVAFTFGEFLAEVSKNKFVGGAHNLIQFYSWIWYRGYPSDATLSFWILVEVSLQDRRCGESSAWHLREIDLFFILMSTPTDILPY